MTKVSRWTLAEQREKELLNQFWDAITLLEDKGEVINFLKALLMPSETIMLAKRIDMVKLHDSDLSVAEIRKLLHITKVTAYKWKERYGLYRNEFKIIVDRLKELEQKRLAREAERREVPKPSKRKPLLAAALATAAVVGYKKHKKLKKRRSTLAGK